MIENPKLSEPAKRMVAVPGGAARPTRARADAADKRLVVGREICLSGQISACDTLVVEGRVEASLADSRRMEIVEGGFFKGKVEIAVAEINGRFEGELIARDRLVIRRSGVVTGASRYAALEIESMDEHTSELQSL